MSLLKEEPTTTPEESGDSDFVQTEGDRPEAESKKHIIEVPGGVIDTDSHIGMIDASSSDIQERNDLIRATNVMRSEDKDVRLVRIIATDVEGNVVAEADIEPDRVSTVCRSSIVQSAMNGVEADVTDPVIECVRALEVADRDIPHAV